MLQDEYRHEALSSNQFVYSRYFKSLGQTFYIPKEKTADMFAIEKHAVGHKPTEFSPIKVLETEVRDNIDQIIESNFDEPFRLITLLYTFLLNIKNDQICDTIFDKIVCEYFCSDSFKVENFSISMCYQVIKILTFVELHTVNP
jgi:hypothetical protein